MLTVATVFTALAFLLPLRPIHRAMCEAKLLSRKLLQHHLARLNPLAVLERSEADTRLAEEMKKLKEQRELLAEIDRTYAKAPTWPFALSATPRIFTTVFGPLTVYLFDQIRMQILG